MTDPQFIGLRPSSREEADRIERAPYPGLRPFSRNEADIFFGRESHIDTMIDRLAEHRFLTVTGDVPAEIGDGLRFLQRLAG